MMRLFTLNISFHEHLYAPLNAVDALCWYFIFYLKCSLCPFSFSSGCMVACWFRVGLWLPVCMLSRPSMAIRSPIRVRPHLVGRSVWFRLRSGPTSRNDHR